MTISEFCKLINFSNKQYYDIVNFCKQNKGYNFFKIPKKSGEDRTIFAPVEELKKLQIKIKKFLEGIYNSPKACNGFVKGRSTKTNAMGHVGKKWVLNIDISDFFPSINFGRIWGLFKSSVFNFDDALATTLAIVCCHDGKLPQGAPTSPILANMICCRMDKKLIKFASFNKCKFSRYADDITLSTNLNVFPKNIAITNEDGLLELTDEFEKIIKDNGFILNSNKTRLAYRTKCQLVTGIVINKKLNLKRKYYRQLRAILHNCKKEGLQKTALKNGFDNDVSFKIHICGKMSYYKSIVGSEHTSYNNLCKMYNKYVEYKFKNCFYNKSELIANAMYIIESEDSQGTAFLLKGYGLVTCKHCLGIKLNENCENDDFIVTKAKIEKKYFIYKENYPEMKLKIKVKKIFNHLDCAILEIQGSEFQEIEFKAFKGINNEEINKCTLLGFPKYAEGSTINENDNVQITGRKNFFGIDYYCIDKPIIEGNSGGPLINHHGDVVGIACRGGADMQEALESGFNAVLPIKYIIEN